MEDIEDLTTNLEPFVSELSIINFNDNKEYDKWITKLRKKYKVNPSKIEIRKTYNKLLARNKVKSNYYLDNLKKKSIRSSSGVAVITILTSPFPEFIKNGKKIKQSFSCGKNCSYCPDEPEVKLNLEIVNIINETISVSTDLSNLHIKIINYVVFKDKNYDVIYCNNFTENSFDFKLKKPHKFNLGDKLIGIKIAQPRSYLHDEPGVLRANKNNFDAVEQIYDRADTLEKCGHIPDKIEILVLGGTWSHYPKEYQYEFVRDIYYAANTYKNYRGRERNTLEEEIMINEKAECRIIGLTLETRPDCITKREIKLLRKYNTTRVQLGVQHIDDDVLENINRGCKLEHTINSAILLKHNGFKLDWHLMPDLPGSSFEKDYEMFKKMFTHQKMYNHKHHIVYKLKYPELIQADQLKIYPCATVPHTEILKLYKSGEYKPYSEDIDKLIELLIYIKSNIYPWIRINRIIRDIPTKNIIGGNNCVHLHDIILNIMKKKNLKSECMRTREVRNNYNNIDKAELFIREYNSFYGKEYFLSFESPDNEILYGFLRLRINYTNKDLIYEELNDCAFVRELHVYGQIVKHGTSSNKVQHQGFGKKLLKKAEEITLKNNIKKLAIISGVGVREYYEKNGYKLIKTYMIKELNYNLIIIKYAIMIIIMFLFVITIYFIKKN